MGKFSNFYSGGDDSHPINPAPHDKNRSQKLSREQKVWKDDFDKCSTPKDFEEYIRIYSKYPSNTYVAQAEARLHKVQSQTSYRDNETPPQPLLKPQPKTNKQDIRHTSYSKPKNIHSPGTKFDYSEILPFIWKAFWVSIVLGSVFGISYCTNDSPDPYPTPTPLPVPDSTPRPKPDNSNDQSSERHTEERTTPPPNYEPEYGYRDVWVPCYQCGGTGECNVCHGEGQYLCTDSQGNILDIRDCPNCLGNKTCRVCFGQRGHYEKQQYQIK